MADETEPQFIPIPESNTTMALIGATQRSFEIILPLSTAKSNHKEVQVILHRIQEGGTNYISSVSESFKTAESGFAFAKRAQDLCTSLASGREECSDELIHDSIAEMREIAQKAHIDAKAATQMFDANRREFTEIRATSAETFKTIKNKHIQVIASKEEAEAKATSWAGDVPVVGQIMAKVFKSKAKGHAKKAVSCEEALQSLEPADKDLERLMVEMDVVAEYWMGVDTELKDIDTRVKALRDDHMLQMRIKGLSRDWKGVARDHKRYITALNTLLNHNPQYKPFLNSTRAITSETSLPKDEIHRSRSTRPNNERHGSRTTLPTNEGHGSGATLPNHEGHGSAATLPRDRPGSSTTGRYAVRSEYLA